MTTEGTTEALFLGNMKAIKGEGMTTSVNEIFSTTGFFRPHGRLLH